MTVTGCCEETLAQCKPLASKVVSFIMTHGIKSFTVVWADIGKMAFDAAGGGAAAVAQLDALLGESPSVVVEEEPSIEVAQPSQLAGTTRLSKCVNGEESGDKLGLDVAERWEEAVKQFEIYDYDGSGTINSALELYEVTLAICFKLSRDTDPVSPDLIKEICQTIDVEANPLDVEGYMEWLREQRVR